VPEFRIRKESPADHAGVDRIQQSAFGRTEEARLVRALRSSAKPRLSLVAELRGEVIGHIYFSPVWIEGATPSPPAAGLAPLAVSPPLQHQGAGSALVSAGLRACASLGWELVFVLGPPAYYSRFGFVSAPALGLRYGSEAFDSAVQVVELAPGVLSHCRGWVLYHPAFALV
jgi:putative acetyltransferase